MLLYIDISAVSFIIPSVTAIAVAVGSFVYLRVKKAKSKVSKALGIDENAGKEVEEDVVLTDEETVEEKAEEAVKAAEEKAEAVEEKAEDAAETVEEKVEDVAETVADKAKEFAGTAAE